MCIGLYYTSHSNHLEGLATTRRLEVFVRIWGFRANCNFAVQGGPRNRIRATYLAPSSNQNAGRKWIFCWLAWSLRWQNPLWDCCCNLASSMKMPCGDCWWFFPPSGGGANPGSPGKDGRCRGKNSNFSLGSIGCMEDRLNDNEGGGQTMTKEEVEQRWRRRAYTFLYMGQNVGPPSWKIPHTSRA